MHGRQETRWNLARPRDNIGNNFEQPCMGTDTIWFPVVGYEEVTTYEGIDVDDGTGPDADL